MVSLYVVTNKTNGKQYVGMTSLPAEQRWACHLSEARNGGVRVFCQALRKYGEQGFDWQVVASARTPEDAAASECALIQQYKSAYNMTAGGDGVAGLHPAARARKGAAVAASWEDPAVRAARMVGQQIAAKRVDQKAKGRKISATKKLGVEKTRAQAKARCEADGNAQIRAALATRWASPEAQNYDKSFFGNEQYRETQRTNSLRVWRDRRVKKAVLAREMAF
jgi:hypothetical protein